MAAHIDNPVIVFIITWILLSIPVWLAAKFFTKNSSFFRSMVATFAAVLIFTIIFYIFSFFGFTLLGVIVGFIGILFVFKTIFYVGWLGALGIAIMALVFAIIISVILVAVGINISPMLYIRPDSSVSTIPFFIDMLIDHILL